MRALEAHAGVDGLQELDWKALVRNCNDVGENIAREAAVLGADLMVTRSRRRPHRAASSGINCRSSFANRAPPSSGNATG